MIHSRCLSVTVQSLSLGDRDVPNPMKPGSLLGAGLVSKVLYNL